jgi:hypothetical protein
MYDAFKLYGMLYYQNVMGFTFTTDIIDVYEILRHNSQRLQSHLWRRQV